jgi:hypothetical protein
MASGIPMPATPNPVLRRCLPLRALAVLWLLLAALASPGGVRAQQTAPVELVRLALQNQVKDDSNLHLFTWKELRPRGHGTQVEQLVSTPSGTISRVVLIDGKPLNSAQQSEENERIRKMTEPAQLRRKLKEQKEDDERTRKLLGTIPDAFDFQTIGSVSAPNGHKLTRIKFSARPGFNPPNHEAIVFTAMQGEVVVDETARRLAKIDGTLFKDVTFGWGILARLYAGGRFLVEQSEVTPSHWETTRMILRFDGKALLIKPIHIDDNETSWDFHPVPPMSVEQARDFLSHASPPAEPAPAASS